MMLFLVGRARVSRLSRITVAALATAVALQLMVPSSYAISNDGISLKCWISESDECNVTAVFPALEELRFYSYLPADRHLLEATMGNATDASDCACFGRSVTYGRNVTRLTLGLRASNRTAAVTAQTLLALPNLLNLSYVSSLWLEGSGIYSLPQDFFKSVGKLQRLTITGTSSGRGFAFDTEQLRASLKDIDLTNNSFTYVSNDSVCTLNSLAENANASVLLAGNPFGCDCTLQPLYNWLQNGSGRSAVADKGSLTCSAGSGATQIVVLAESEIFTKCIEVDVSKHLDAAYVVMSVCLAVIVVIVLLVMWRKASSYLSFCLNRRPSYAAVSV